MRGYRQVARARARLQAHRRRRLDSIVAEDIADFPDLNLAESLQRIPGVSISRDAGEGRNITVRGLGPQFTRVRINGMEGLTTAGGTDSSGGTNRDRGFDFNIFAAELFSTLSVRKTAAAEIDEGLAWRDHRPQHAAAVRLRRAHDGRCAAKRVQRSLERCLAARDVSLQRHFGERSVGRARLPRLRGAQLLEEGHSTVRWQPGALTCPALRRTADAADRDAANAAVDAAFTPRLPRYGILGHDLERLGRHGLAAVSAERSHRTRLSMCCTANLDSTRTEDFLEAPDFSAGASGNLGRAGIDVLGYQIDADNNMIYGVFDDVDIRVRVALRRAHDRVRSGHALDLTHELSDKLQPERARRQLGVRSTTTRSRRRSLRPRDVDGYAYDYRQDDRLPLITYGFNVNDPASYVLTQIRLRPQTADNTFDNLEARSRWIATDHLTFKGGVSAKEYEFATTELRRSNGTTANQEGIVTGAGSRRRFRSTAAHITLEDPWDLPAGRSRAGSFPTSRAPTSCSTSAAFPLGPEPLLGNNRSVLEKNEGIYLQVDFNAMLGEHAAARQRRRALHRNGPDTRSVTNRPECAVLVDRRSRL